MATYLLKSFGNSVAKCLKRASNCNGFGNIRANFHSTPRNLQTICSDRPAYITRLALPPDYDNVVDFMCDVYYKDEPTIVNMGLAGTEAPLVWRKMMDDLVRCGLSFIAENHEHCIIGAALNSPTTPQEIQMLCNLAKCCQTEPISKVIEFYAYVLDSARVWERFCVHTIFEQSSLAISEEYRGLGIAQRLIHESWILARDCGYRLFRMDCNNSYCARICRGFGWEEVWRIPFSQYVNNGEVVFKCVKEPHTDCQVFVDRLRYCKTFLLPYKKCKRVTPPPA
ncbi:arylalkylamine N-acetyltransferase 1 [Osmia lignaria lignaria]|uniref:arylalkylamine N-acetyltransferase 1 n=1 Tax=Osmia lignaria lignaria TaxID=1437193 RepID=UPI0014794A38|nr:uncharacterized protein LOC117611617 [Osmia lignaria]XP_034195519.1 uncharacterized protein LOC117611617 [Osmia lignaria]